MKLYEISEEIRGLMDSVEERGGEFAEAEFARLDELEMAFESKVENVAFAVREIEAQSAVIAKEASALQAKARSRSNDAKALKGYLLAEMRKRDLPRINGKVFTIRRQRSAPSVVIEAESVIPKEFWHQPDPVLVKTDILKAIKAGQEVPGAALHQGEHIRIA